MSDIGLDIGLADIVFVPRREAPRRGLARARRGLVQVLASLVVALALLAYAAVPRAPSSAMAPRPAPAPTWIDIPKPVQIYSLQAPELAGAPLAYAARRRSIGGGREDLLAFGALAVDQPGLRLRIYRREPASATHTPFLAAIARQAAEAGLSVSRDGPPDLLPTRFGRFEIADVTLSAGAAPTKLPCEGFRLAIDTPGLSITGLACGFPALSRARLACLIDRLDVASAGEDKALAAFFAGSELRRDAACRGMRLGPDEVHAAWLDDKPATPRRSLRRR